jgi:amino acid adenylation domain-containing protein/non-ribosomal peptide synthase protein (TIGR01720 family)
VENLADIYELSPMQQGMLFHTLYAPDSGLYFEQRHCLIQGPFNVSAFRQAWQAVVDRHAILRTAFYWAELEKPLQVVRINVSLPWTELDWQNVDPAEQAVKLEEFLQCDRDQGFDLQQAPLMRCTLIQLSATQYRFVWSHHHLLMDGWSNGILLREVLALYGQTQPLPPAIPYRYCVLWLQKQDQISAEKYWRSQLLGLTSPTQLAPSRPFYDSTYLDYSVQIPPVLTTDLLSLTRQHRLTLNTLIQATWALVLSRYTGDSDIIFGATVSGRPADLEGVESMVGLFINTLPVRIQIDSKISLIEFLQKIQAESVERSQYEYSSLTQIQDWSEISRGVALFESLIVFENYPISVEEILRSTNQFLQISDVNGFAKTNYPLTLTVIPGAEILLQIGYNSELFKSGLIEELFRRFQTLLEQIPYHLAQPISKLSLLTAHEKEQILSWSNPKSQPHSLTPVHQLFEQQAEQSPEQIAVIFGDESITYQVLNQRANQLAHYLRSHNIKPETRIGICLERSIDLIVCLFGVLKSGAAYVPFDPATPSERFNYLLSDAQVEILIDRDTLGKIASHSTENLNLDFENSHLAYIIYTSGSTGQPKGVMIEHRSLSNFVMAAIDEYQFTQHDRILQFASISFDAAVEEIYPCLVVGGTLILRTERFLDSAATFLKACGDYQISVIDLPTAYWHQLTLEITQRSLPLPNYLRLAIIGGEAAQPEIIRAWQQSCGQVKLINGYGPTEATVVATTHTITSDQNSIGQAIANVQTYVLDPDLNLCPIGVPGALYIGGAGLARGYWNRPDLTAERFIQNPLQPETRLYHTGDLVCWNSDSTLQYLGRTDHQIKLRGFRIEPGEIESALMQHSDISQAIVMLHTEMSHPILVAYLVSTCSEKPDLRSYLASKLPDYMIPGAFVWLDHLPLTPTGKLDRRALPTPESVKPISVAAQTSTQELLAGIWQAILNLDAVGITDNFFELGGHSLLAMRMTAQIQQVFTVEIPLRQIFEHPTIVELAAEIESASRSSSPHTAISRISRDGQLPLSFAQQRLWFLSQLEPDSSAYNVPAILHLSGTLDITSLRQSFATLAQRHEILRTAFKTVDGQPQIAIAPNIETNFSVVDLSQIALRTHIIQQLIRAESQTPFNLESSPLWRAVVICLSEEEHILAFTLHHIITDGWSMEIIAREIAELYPAYVQKQPIPESNTAIQYVDFAHWQRQWLKEDILAQQISYWKQHLLDAPPLLELPTDYPRPAVQNFRGDRYQCQLSEDLSKSLKVLSQRNHVTLFMTLLAALNTLFHRYTGQNEIVIGTPIANRHYAGTESLIGFFANTLALKTSLTENPTFEQLLAQVRECVLSGYAHQDVPFEQVVDVIQPQRSLSYSPIFQVLLAVENAPLQSIELDNLCWTPMPVEHCTAKFDLTLIVKETSSHLTVQWEYNRDLFTPETIARWQESLQNLLTEIVANHNRRISEYSLLNQAQEQQILRDWNATERSYPTDRTIHELFEQQVEQSPNAVALICNSEQLTYHELNARANQLAHHLQQLGVSLETPVGICLERSSNAIAAMLGILKAGGFYVPIDPNLPDERFNFLLDDAQIKVVVTCQAYLNRLSNRVQIVDIDIATSKQPSSNLNNVITSDQLAYALYTSGSTGTPKGVCTNHRSVVRLVTACRFADLSNQEIFLHAAPIAFDASTFEIWGALLNGAKIVVLEQSLPTLKELALTVQNHQITALWLTAGLFHLMIEEQLDCFQSVKQLIAGGDVLSSRSIQTLLRNYPNCQVINGYGPTEGTTFTCCHRVEASDLVEASPPIGRPIQNTQVYVLDRYLQPVPIGIPGELYISGDGLARGYLERSHLTAAAFLPNPFEPDAIMYKTGDRVCWRTDGALKYFGRFDNQVKLRGFRVELGEVETAIAQCPGVEQALVIYQRDRSCLIAYFTPEIDPTVLRQFLHTKLPDYAIPAYFVPLNQFPLTINGKVDREALPLPEIELNPTATPQNDIERTVCEIWQTILRLPSIGVHDNFFELGGDSILAIQVVSRMSQAGFQTTPKQLFQYPTIATLAQVITPLSSDEELEIVEGSVPLTPIQHWFIEQSLPNPHHFNQSVFLEIHEPLEYASLKQALQYLVQYHDALRLRFSPCELWQQEIQPLKDEISLTWFDFSHLSTYEQAIAEATNLLQSSLSLENKLFQAAYFDLGQTSHRLFLVVHHLAIDSVSWRILLDDLNVLYQQSSHAKPLKLPPKTTSFKLWAERLQTYSPTELNYWLSAHRPTSPIPVDMPTGENTIADVAQFSLTLISEQTRALLKDAAQAYNTQIHESILSAIAQGLSAWTGDSTLLIDLESHGRNTSFTDINLSRTVGWLTAIFPVWLEISPFSDPGETLIQIKEQLRSIPNHGIGYGVLRYLQHHQVLQDFSQAEISFNYLGQIQADFAPESSGERYDRAQPRRYKLEITSYIKNDQLYFEWAYSHQQYRSDTIERAAMLCLEALQDLIYHCQLPNSGRYTPSDFELVQLDQAMLDRVLTNVELESRNATVRRVVEDVYPLSPMQQGMLFHSLYAPESGAYIVQISYELHGKLDTERFCLAWQYLIDRHSILRTAFAWENLEQPLQVVGHQIDCSIELLDWRNLSETEEQLTQLLQAQRTQGFLLSKAPLMQVGLIQISDELYQFVWNYHHLLLDGWSVPILLKEFLTTYQALCESRSPKLPTAQPYRNYIAWLQQQDKLKAEQFWREKLKGLVAPTQIPVDHYSDRASYLETEIQFSPEQTTQLQQFAKQHQLTLNTLIQGAWALLLSRYSSEIDIMFGVVSSGRPAALVGSESMVGLFINTLPLRITAPPDASLPLWLQELQLQQIEAQQYEYCSLTEIHQWSEIPRSTPLFESIVIFENYPVDQALKAGFADVEICNIQATEQTNYPLTLYAIAQSSLTLKLLYDCDRFHADTSERILSHLKNLLMGMVTQPNCKLAELPLLTQAEQDQQSLWNQTTTEAPTTCVHEYFEHQVKKSPDAIALQYQSVILTYQELNRQANQLAHQLIELGITPGAKVGICLERSPSLIIALLAVLKVGAVYIPLDPTYPTQRLAFILQDAKIDLLLTQNSLVELTTPAFSIESDFAHQPIHNPQIKIQLDQSVYLIYTSGSTGIPKGVEVLHRGLSNVLTSLQRTFSVAEKDTLLAVTTIAFDIAALEIFLPLISGACLHLGSSQLAIDAAQLSHLLSYHPITLMQATPATWRMLIAQGWQGSRSLQILCGGEALPPDLAEELLSRGKALWNLYGPTETTIWSAVHRVESSERISIGRPIANTQFYVLDDQLQPLPIGVSGQLYIGGLGLAQGYWQRPDLTQEKFIEHTAGRIYQTGDRVRWRSDGTLEYLGRTDYQVKLRGYRIELGEIESVLVQHPKVEQAIVLLKEDRLIAYFTSLEATKAELRYFLASRLPSYMIPSVLIELEQFPLTPNGKLDRNALPAPENTRLTQEPTVLPQTDVERSLSEIWRSLLEIEQVSIHDNFFELGGHSLLMVRLQGAIRDRFSVDIALVDLFRYPTIRDLADYLSQDSQVQTLDLATREKELEAGKQRLRQRLQQRKLATTGKTESE